MIGGIRSLIRNNVNIKFRHIGQQQLCQCRLSEQMLSGNGTLPPNDSSDTGYAGKFRDLIRDVITVYSFDVCTELLRQFSVFLQPPFVLLGGKGKIRRFYKQCSELTIESLSRCNAHLQVHLSHDPGSWLWLCFSKSHESIRFHPEPQRVIPAC